MSSRILKRIIELEQQRDDALAALASAQDRIEDLEQALAAIEAARLRELDDMEATQFDASIYGQ